MKPHWHDIECPRWEGGKVSVETNKYSEGPVILEMEGDGYETYDLSESMTPTEARALADALNKAADAAERAGKVS